MKQLQPYNKAELHEKIVDLLTKHKQEISLKRDTATKYDSYAFEYAGENKAILLCESVVIFYQSKEVASAYTYTHTEPIIVDEKFREFEQSVWKSGK